MIHPNMATMLGTVVSDVAISSGALKQATLYAVERSFNAISIDGDTSTNDTVLVLANAVAENSLIAETASKDFDAFQEQLTSFTRTLAKLIVRGTG
jgi:glutamate N-acetyltransferase/amino-acid N-acetyltransferase